MGEYRIVVRGTYDAKGAERPFSRMQYAADASRTWDGAWYTPYPAHCKRWKTRAGAGRWLAARTDIAGYVEEIPYSVSEEK